MNLIAKTLFSPVKWVSHKVADGNDKTATAKNFLSSMTSACLFILFMPKELAKQAERFQAVEILKGVAGPFQHVVDKINPIVTNALPSVKTVFGTLEVTKDYLTYLELYGYVRDLDAPDLPQKTFAKKANLGCKLGFSFIETVILLPRKFNWYDLVSYSPVSFITSVTLKIGSSTLVMASSLFAIWGAEQDKEKAQKSTAKNDDRLLKLDAIRKATGEVQVTDLVKTYLSGRINSEQKIKATTDKLMRLCVGLDRIEDEIATISNRIKSLPINETDQVKELSEKLEKLKKNIPVNQEKIHRTIYFHKVATGFDLGKELLENIEKEWILSNNLTLKGVCGNSTYTTLTQISNHKTADQMKSILHTAKKSGTKAEFKAIEEMENALKTHMEKKKRFLDSGINGYSENAVKHIIDYKIRKFSGEIEFNDAKIEKANKAQNYEISKIAIVASVTLGLLIAQGMAPALLVAYGTAIETATWYSGLAICITGLQRTIYETFYWKEPDQNARPTTNLRQFAAPAA